MLNVSSDPCSSSSPMTASQQSAQRLTDPSDDAIEAIIHHATSYRQDLRPLRDTRTQLFVGNLPYRVRWQDLKDLFRKAGTVLRADVSLGPDNRSRGYGTVLLATAEDAGRAVDMFNGYTWQTRVLEVRLDRLIPDYDQARMAGIGIPVGSTAGVTRPPVPGGFSTVSGQYLHLGTGGSVSGAANSNHNALCAGFTPLATDAAPSTNLSVLLGGHNLYVSQNLPTSSPFSQNLSSRPSSSSGAVQDSLDFLLSSSSGTGGAEFQSIDPNANRTLFVGNLPFHIQWQDLKDLFRQAGTILRADVALGPDNRSRGFGTVVFATDADAERAVQMFNGYEHYGRVLNVQYEKLPSSTSTIPAAATTFLPPSSHGNLNIPHQQLYVQHFDPLTSQQSSTSSTAVHSAASSPLPSHASPLSSGQPSRREGYPNLSLDPRFDLPTHPRVHGSTTDQQHSGHLALPPGFLYDYGPPSMPTSPHEIYQRSQQEKGYFERPPAHQQYQTERDRRKRDGRIKEGSLERMRYQQGELEWKTEPESEPESHTRPHAQAPANSSLDIESLSTSLASMKYSPSGGRSQSLARAESSLSPTSISTSLSVSVSGSTSNSNSNPSSVFHSTAPSKPPSTKPTWAPFTSPNNLPSVSSSSLPAQFDNDGLSLGAGFDATGRTISAGGSRKASVADQYNHPYPLSISTRTSTDTATSTNTESSGFSDTGSTALSEDEHVGYRSPFMTEKMRASSVTPSESASGRQSRSSRTGFVAGSRSQSRAGGKDDENPSQSEEATLQMQKQHPHHPGPIALPPPPSMTFNPMQMPMMMPLATMTPGHPHGHVPTPHAYPMMNMSPLYHPAHHGSPSMAAMAAAAMHGGGSPSPFAMYPGPPAMAGAMMTLTPHGLPPITPSMPPFTFYPQQYYGSLGVKGPAEDGRERKGGEGGEGRDRDRAQAQVHQMPRTQQPLRLNLNTAGMPGASGFSPGVALSPGTFYGRPGQVPHPNPYINAAVGAPVHAHAHAQSPLQHPAAAYGYVAYPYPIPSPPPVQGDGGEPQGYFDHVYFPGAGEASEGGGGGGKEDEAVRGGDSVSEGGRVEDEQEQEHEDAPSRTHSVGPTRASSVHGTRGKFHRSGSDPMSAGLTATAGMAEKDESSVNGLKQEVVV